EAGRNDDLRAEKVLHAIGAARIEMEEKGIGVQLVGRDYRVFCAHQFLEAVQQGLTVALVALRRGVIMDQDAVGLAVLLELIESEVGRGLGRGVNEDVVTGEPEVCLVELAELVEHFPAARRLDVEKNRIRLVSLRYHIHRSAIQVGVGGIHLKKSSV